jgi:E3 ubiquitin-protein ligase BIG BROTHER-like protein
MDGSSKGIGGGASADKPTTDHQDQNASPNVPAGAGAGASAAAAEGRRPFTSLSQEEADLALARVLQEQVSSRDLGISRVG